MDDFNNINPMDAVLNTMRNLADSRLPVGMEIGKVISVFPKFEIKVGDLPLYRDNLFINKQLLQHERDFILPQTTVVGQTNSAYVENHGSHSHSLINIQIPEGKITYKTLFQEGDIVLLQSINEEQKYIVMAILVDGKDIIENGITL